MRDGKLNSSNFGERMRGSGVHWEMVRKVFKLHCERLGLNEPEEGTRWESAQPNTFRCPTAQQSLFD
jgi:hypothetical protein